MSSKKKKPVVKKPDPDPWIGKGNYRICKLCGAYSAVLAHLETCSSLRAVSGGEVSGGGVSGGEVSGGEVSGGGVSGGEVSGGEVFGGGVSGGGVSGGGVSSRVVSSGGVSGKKNPDQLTMNFCPECHISFGDHSSNCIYSEASDGETEVFYAPIIVGKKYWVIKVTRKTGNSPKERYFSTENPVFVGEYLGTYTSEFRNSPPWSDFLLNGKKHSVYYLPDGTTFFIIDPRWERRKEFAIFWASVGGPLAVPSISLEEEEQDKRESFMEDPANDAFLRTKMAAVFFSPDSTARRTIASYL